MINYTGSIDTDRGIGTILSNFSSDYINHIIGDSLNMRFRPFSGPMPNMVDVLERQFLSIASNSKDYVDKVNEVRTETYKEIILIICNYYNLTFTGDFDSMRIDEIYGITHTLYDIFISRFTDYLIDFFVSYIVNNADSIASYLKTDDTVVKPKDTSIYSSRNYIDPKFILIHCNVNKVIYDIAGHDISLQALLNYFVEPNISSRLNDLLADNGDIYKYHYTCYITDQRYSASLLTNIKLKLQSRTQEAFNILG